MIATITKTQPTMTAVLALPVDVSSLHPQGLGYLGVLVDIWHFVAKHLLPIREQIDNAHVRRLLLVYAKLHNSNLSEVQNASTCFPKIPC